MDTITAEQALENAKGLTFEKVWAALMETRTRMEKSDNRLEERIAETAKIVADLSKNFGGVQNTIGRFVESMFTADLLSKFNELGYDFTQQSTRKKYVENKETIAEIDAILENGEYILLAEVKTEMREETVDDHLERIERVRKYMDDRNDSRKIIGAVAAGVVPENVMRYAQKKGLYVITQSGDSSAIADMPEGLEARVWLGGVV